MSFSESLWIHSRGEKTGESYWEPEYDEYGDELGGEFVDEVKEQKHWGRWQTCQ